jgi:hypothetical protein
MAMVKPQQRLCNQFGGTLYNRQLVQFPASYVGKYFFAEVCTGWVRLFDPATNTATDFASDIFTSGRSESRQARESLLLSFGINGKVFRVQFNGSPPSITTQPQIRQSLRLRPQLSLSRRAARHAYVSCGNGIR